MQNKAHDISGYRFAAADRVLLDANIWLFLYAPSSIALPSHLRPAVAAYTRAWAAILSSGAKAFLDAIIFSEVINRLLDDEWQRIDPPDARGVRKYRKRKDFRRSTDYPAAATTVEQLARLIVAESQAIDQPFSQWDLDQLLGEFGRGSTDWNDQLLVENCRHHGLKLLTHDADHVSGGIEVLTANRRLIAACS
jgi:predicted nucleic acid-binding protein